MITYTKAADEPFTARFDQLEVSGDDNTALAALPVELDVNQENTTPQS